MFKAVYTHFEPNLDLVGLSVPILNAPPLLDTHGSFRMDTKRPMGIVYNLKHALRSTH